MGYFDGFPPLGSDLGRLAEYRRRRNQAGTLEYAERRATEAKLKRDLGEKLTRAEENYIAFTPAPFGTASGCHYRT